MPYLRIVSAFLKLSTIFACACYCHGTEFTAQLWDVFGLVTLQSVVVFFRRRTLAGDASREPFILTNVIANFSTLFALVSLKVITRLITETVSEIATISRSDDAFYLGLAVASISAGFESTTLALPPQSTWPTFKKILQLVLSEPSWLVTAIICLILASVFQATIPHFIGLAIAAVQSRDLASVVPPLKYLLGSSLGFALFSACRGVCFTVLGGKVNRSLKDRLFRTILQKPIEFFDQTKTGEITSRLSQDCQKVTEQVQFNVNYFTRNLLGTIITGIFMLGLSTRLTIVTLVSVPCVVYVSQKYGDYVKRIQKDIQEGLAECNAAAEETISAIHTVRSFACEVAEGDRFHSKLDLVYSLALKQARIYSPYVITIYTLPNAIAALIILYGAKLTISGLLAPSVLISFMLYLTMLTDQINAMGDIYTSVLQAVGAAEKVFEMMEEVVIRSPLQQTKTISRGQVELRHVFFAYPTRPGAPILRDLSFVIPSGKFAALVGPSGNGKSTVLALLQRWYTTGVGQVLIDDTSVEEYDHVAYHQAVSSVSQEPVLFARSIKENILLGIVNVGEKISPELEARVMHAAQLANAHEFISALPDGYDTQVGLRGLSLSGGQKQRIAIARAIVRQPKVLILDEATSALDATSEKHVQEALDHLKGITTIVVAHRLSTVKHADVIFYVDEGRIAEQGTHEELIARGGLYRKLVETQMH